MKKTNKNSCAITRIWPTLDDMKKDLFIDLDKQEITRLSTGNKLKFFSTGSQKQESQYCRITFKQKSLLVHRLFFYWHHGFLPKLVDHKDINPQNNNIENLRELTKSENTRNSNKIKNKKKTSSKYKGVYWDKEKRKWRAVLGLNNRLLYLGCFDNEDDAGQAYNDKVRELSLEEVSVMNDTPQERARKNIQFDPLPPEMNHIRDLFLNIEPLVDFK
jgi:hypothetical protein